MIAKKVLYVCINAGAVLLLLQASVEKPAAQDEATSRFRVNVVLVELNVAVIDNKGNYVTGLRPEDFVITEDNIPEKLSNFEERQGARPYGRASRARGHGQRGCAGCGEGQRIRLAGASAHACGQYVAGVWRRECVCSVRHEQLHVP